MSTTTCNPDGSLTMTGNDKPQPKPATVLNIVAVKNGWMVYEYVDTLYREMHGVEHRPSYVFNDVIEMLRCVQELLVPDYQDRNHRRFLSEQANQMFNAIINNAEKDNPS